MKVWIGIDPGKKGGFAIITQNGQTETIMSFPWDDKEFVAQMALISGIEKKIACVEKVGAVRGNGIVSMFSFGKSCGFIEGVLSAFGVPYQLVPPQTWKKEFSLNSDKQKSIEVCRKLFPNVCLLPTPRCTKESDGIAEALLLSCYAKRHM